MQNVSGTGGGDFDECYELVLRQARTEFSWTPGSQRALVMIGDADPHSPAEALRQGGESIDWEVELDQLVNMVSAVCFVLKFNLFNVVVKLVVHYDFTQWVHCACRGCIVIVIITNINTRGYMSCN